METVLNGIKNGKIYIDDILLYTKDEESHLLLLDEVLRRLSNHNISIKLEKCHFLKDKVQFLGNFVNSEGISPCFKNKNKILKCLEPNSKKGLQKIIGHLQWYRPYLKNLSIELAPICEKLKDKQFRWTNKDQKIINRCVDKLDENITLNHPDLNKPFELYCDSSEYGCGSVQKQENKVTGIFSHKFTEVESKYTIVEKEFLSIILGLKNFRMIILSCKIKILTDNKIITLGKEFLTNRIHRWLWILEQYDYELIHVMGKNNLAQTNYHAVVQQ